MTYSQSFYIPDTSPIFVYNDADSWAPTLDTVNVGSTSHDSSNAKSSVTFNVTGMYMDLDCLAFVSFGRWRLIDFNVPRIP